ncbi:MAG: heavy-metal-associated domain-containing protein [Deltaproteobacteria bacterium]|nr:heavy-metal-associated domain-containing protein [Deltaproteobacteria bacterium]
MKDWIWVILAAAVLLICCLVPFLKAAEPPQVPPSLPQAAGEKITVHIEGLSCPLCVFGVSKHLKKIEGVEGVDVSLKEGTAVLQMDPSAEITDEEIQRAVEKAGFRVSKIERGP